MEGKTNKVKNFLVKNEGNIVKIGIYCVIGMLEYFTVKSACSEMYHRGYNNGYCKAANDTLDNLKRFQKEEK